MMLRGGKWWLGGEEKQEWVRRLTYKWKVSLNFGDQLPAFCLVWNFLFLSARCGPVYSGGQHIYVPYYFLQTYQVDFHVGLEGLRLLHLQVVGSDHWKFPIKPLSKFMKAMQWKYWHTVLIAHHWQSVSPLIVLCLPSTDLSGPQKLNFEQITIWHLLLSFAVKADVLISSPVDRFYLPATLSFDFWMTMTKNMTRTKKGQNCDFITHLSAWLYAPQCLDACTSRPGQRPPLRSPLATLMTLHINHH